MSKITVGDGLLVCCGHSSVCAVHNAPALPPGPCSCGLGGVCELRPVADFLKGLRAAITELDAAGFVEAAAWLREKYGGGK